MQAFSSPFRSLGVLATAVALHASCSLIVDRNLDDKPLSSTSSTSTGGAGGTENGGTGGVGGGGSSMGGGGSAPCNGTCAADETCCTDKCYSLQTDIEHCGTCDKMCAPGEKCCGGTCAACCVKDDCTTSDHDCVSGVCVLDCKAPAVECNNACTVLDTDPKNCGSCSNDCLSGHPCVGKVCQSGWATMSTVNALSPRQRAAAAWTGSKLFVWGGLNPQGVLDDGALYDPATDTWSMLPSTGSPGPRVDAVAVTMNNQVLVWGGGDDASASVLNSGKVFDLASSSWKDIKPVSSYASRNPIAVWTGTKVLLWGGKTPDSPTNTGALYDPATNDWTSTSISSVPSARTGVGWTWSGTELLMFGGRPFGVGSSAEGFAYNPSTNTWRKLPSTNAPSARYDVFAAWTGSSMLIVGGRNSTTYDDALRYDPALDKWSAAPVNPIGKRSAPTMRTGWTATWGGKILVAGGVDETQMLKVDGRVYDSVVNDWGAQSVSWPSTADHEFGVGVWTGTEFILWSGLDNSALTPVGERYRP